jgi:uncharacterized membrane protein
MTSRTEQIVIRSIIVTASAALVAWFFTCLATRDVSWLAIVIGIVGSAVVVGAPVWALVRYVPQLVRLIRSPRA